VFELLHDFQGTAQLFWGDIADADAFADVGDEWDALFAMTMLHGILAALPRQLAVEVWGVGWQAELGHAGKDTFDDLHLDVSAKVAEDAAEESIDVDSLAVHNVGAWHHLQEL